MALELAPLPYAPDALRPALSADNLRYHHGHHHAGYVRTVNSLTRGGELEAASVQEIMARAEAPLATTAAQVWNHEFYWESLSPHREPPGYELGALIERDLGSMDTLVRAFCTSALAVYGGGWTWLAISPAGSLEVLSTPNAGLRLHKEGWRPLLGCDVSEHAYRQDYRGNRAAYLAAFCSVVSWPAAGRRLAAAGQRNDQPGTKPWDRSGRPVARYAPPMPSPHQPTSDGHAGG